MYYLVECGIVDERGSLWHVCRGLPRSVLLGDSGGELETLTFACPKGIAAAIQRSLEYGYPVRGQYFPWIRDEWKGRLALEYKAPGDGTDSSPTG